jgi:Mrp family chromosome partitioning ATPase
MPGLPSEADVLAALKKVNDPELGRNIVDLGMVRQLVIGETGVVSFTLAFTVRGCPMREQMTHNAQAVVASLPGVEQVLITQGEMTPEERKAVFGANPPAGLKLSQFNQVSHVVVIASGKGGVGKSVITSLLAVGMVRRGLRVGILDADVTGASIPRLFGLPPGGLQGNEMGMLPLVTRTGIRVVSANLMVKQEDAPVAWRGQMIAGLINQFWTEAIWGRLDYLLVDMATGTSDSATAVLKGMPVTGALLVTTPQELSAIMARKMARLLQQVNLPVLGLVENMSYLTLPESGSRIDLFGPSHVDAVAQAANAPLWARLPMDPQLNLAADCGSIETVNLPEIPALVDQLSYAVSLTGIRSNGTPA